jgi:hypothetical protein
MLNGRKQVIGQKISAWPELAERLLTEGAVRPYSGNMNAKTKTDFFKPK